MSRCTCLGVAKANPRRHKTLCGDPAADRWKRDGAVPGHSTVAGPPCSSHPPRGWCQAVPACRIWREIADQKALKPGLQAGAGLRELGSERRSERSFAPFAPFPEGTPDSTLVRNRTIGILSSDNWIRVLTEPAAVPATQTTSLEKAGGRGWEDRPAPRSLRRRGAPHRTGHSGRVTPSFAAIPPRGGGMPARS